MTESPQQFGPDGTLVGVLTQPDHTTVGPRLAFLLFNAGVIPRIGPHRMNVKLARALAAQGVAVLRFDLSGQGDSRNAPSGSSFFEQSVRDLQAAMDHLQSTLGIGRFALIGICSGASSAYWTGAADRRVAAIMMVDGYWYRTRWTTWVRDWKRFRAASLGAAWTALRRRVRLGAVRQLARRELQAGVFNADSNPPRNEFSAVMHALVERGAAVAVVYSGSVIDYYSYAAQFRHGFAGEPWLTRVQCLYRPDIDHTFLSLASQRRMIDLVIDWLPEVLKASARQA